MPQTIVAGNWKMHLGPSKTREFLSAFTPPEGEGVPELLIFPPAISVSAALAAASHLEGLRFGLQNIHFEDSGAFTGEISAPMAVDAGVSHVLIGHSERRHVFGETDDEVEAKVSAAVRHGLVPVVCVGETLAERKAGRLQEVLLRQLDAAMEGLPEERVSFHLAYEPVWAIGTGETATPEDAREAHALLRGRLAELRGEAAREDVSILYGGSVKPGNASALMGASEVDGVLVGGASLDPASFAAIARAGVGV